ncbi:hypothetical protein CWATWH0003_2882 [Crocosphaera watsonii WH 0003]|uniref:Uncharacterized protein n=1 Tax=Crocosphaera watsonii WH 0003 TaxID=423471 RepID=G5J5X7_CROWT|nr:hypothetical protein CWATWH0003_2882 [Crocosphaera watsonii WH 0003]
MVVGYFGFYLVYWLVLKEEYKGVFLESVEEILIVEYCSEDREIIIEQPLIHLALKKD